MFDPKNASTVVGPTSSLFLRKVCEDLDWASLGKSVLKRVTPPFCVEMRFFDKAMIVFTFSGFTGRDLSNDTEFSVMFGPDKCGSDDSLKLIINIKLVNPKWQNGIFFYFISQLCKYLTPSGLPKVLSATTWLTPLILKLTGWRISTACTGGLMGVWTSIWMASLLNRVCFSY